MSPTKYKKRPGTSGIQGQLYETKLLSLIFFRATHNNNIENFSLATNVDNIGTFDDICIKAKFVDNDKPLVIFIQAKHRETDGVLTLNNKHDLVKYFDSYLKIRRAFQPSNKDLLFGGKFDETECFFALYTTAKGGDEFTYEGSFADCLNDLIGTGDSCTQPKYEVEDVDFLCKIVIREEITTLAEQIAKFVIEEVDSELSMNNDLMLRYHVILGLEVFDITDIQTEGHRFATFRQDFFETSDEFLVVFKNTLITEILKKPRLDNIEIENALKEFFAEPSDVKLLSKLIGSCVTYTNGKLKIVYKSVENEDLNRQLDTIIVTQATVEEAIAMAAKNELISVKLKVPTAFGNKDLYIRGKDEKIERRLNHLSSKIIELLEKSKPNNIATIEESLGDGFLQLNGGIASAIGNILVFDENCKLLKFREDCAELEDLAKRLHVKLKSKIDNLHEYKLDVKVKKFPKITFERDDYDGDLVKDFFNRLLFFTNQADQKSVEEILKGDIEDHPCNDVNNFRVRSDVVFLKYHDEIQKLWMTPKEGSYLTKKSKIYENAVNNAMSEPLMGVLNIMHKMKSKDYRFREEIIDSLKIKYQILDTVIVTRSTILTAAKIEQYLRNNDHIVLNLEYIFKLQLKHFNTLCKELKNTKKDKTVVILCNNCQNSRNSNKILENVAKAVDVKKIVIVTDTISAQIMTEHFKRTNNTINDEINNLGDMNTESQRKILTTAKVTFQGEEIVLETVIDDKSVMFIEGEVLDQVINNKTLVVGKPVTNEKYERTKHFYIDRRVSRTNNREQDSFEDIENKPLRTLYDLEGDVVLITAIPGMGKSTLLTHLSITTKILNYNVWILRINLLEHTKIFNNWKEQKIAINAVESIKLMCHVAISEIHGFDDVVIELEEENKTVALKQCSGDANIVFELKLFLHFYNTGKLIFIFDGYDEVFPHYANEAPALLKSVRNLPRKHNIWITSRPFNNIRSILEQEFGPSYEIEHFNRTEQDTYLYTFWKTKIPLKNLNEEQLSNVNDFVIFVQNLLPKTSDFCIHSRLQHTPYFKIYINFLEYLKIESLASGINFSYDEYNSFMMRFDERKSAITNFMNDFIAPPLHLYILAEHFRNQILDINKTSRKWDTDITAYIFYEYYLETKLKKIRFEEKNKIDIYNPDNMLAYEKERVDCIAKHKKLGAYAIFYPNLETVFDENDLKKVQNLIKELSDGTEKTGVIRTVAGSIPLFIHMSFAEYFAVEYICDLLKKEVCEEKQKTLWNFVLNTMFFECDVNLFDIFNTKIKMDDELKGIVERNSKIIFDVMSKQKNRGVVFRWSDYEKVDMQNRGLNYKMDRNILMIAKYSTCYENSSEENRIVDFSKFFDFFYLVPKDGQLMAVKA